MHNTFWSYAQNNFAELISAGQESNWARSVVVGQVGDVDKLTVPEDVWPLGGMFPWIPSARVITVKSTSANDSAAGTGMRTGLLIYLDENYISQNFVFTMNGLTEVVLPTCVAINRAIIGTAGSGEVNDGQILFQDQSGGTLRNVIQAGRGITEQAGFTVPAGFTLLVKEFLFSVSAPSGNVPQGGDCGTLAQAV